ncbi:UNKNOWN [Stylonychia lemnae]|uniref:Uncharacterized protein n=1 Tax=Stylonychia lemnae TaxID=5949 RepID=A0A077ZWL7_STYLE|nr:UNKNOWN [Stylonychia lemnae]|eukprot:CDW74300.1 UNKNOWN [Stylonychia lemnae]
MVEETKNIVMANNPQRNQGIFIKCDFYKELKQFKFKDNYLMPQSFFTSTLKYQFYEVPLNPTKKQILNSVQKGLDKFFQEKNTSVLLVTFCGKLVSSKQDKSKYNVVVKSESFDKNNQEEIIDLEYLILDLV